MFSVLLLLHLTSAVPREYVFKGTWETTNRPLDGIQTAVVKRITEEEWQARFYGIWQGVDYDYTVKFTGPPHKLRGTATIDGARYQWQGKINQETFKATFTGDRYTGSFNLKRIRRQ